MSEFYIDIDTAYVAVDRYISRACEVYNEMLKNNDTDKLFRKVASKIVSEHYRELPKLDGAEECMNILNTEYDVIFVSKTESMSEAESKSKYAKSEGAFDTGLYYSDVSEINMSGGIFLSANHETLAMSNADVKYLLSGKSNYDENMCSCIVVPDWYSLLDMLFGGDEDEELREHFRSRVQTFFYGNR